MSGLFLFDFCVVFVLFSMYPYIYIEVDQYTNSRIMHADILICISFTLLSVAPPCAANPGRQPSKRKRLVELVLYYFCGGIKRFIVTDWTHTQPWGE